MPKTQKLEIVRSGTVTGDLLDEIDRQRRIANAIMLAVLGARNSGDDEGIEDICLLHIDSLREISASLRVGGQ